MVVGLPLDPFTRSPSLGLFLTFRPNSASKRWDEAHKKLGVHRFSFASQARSVSISRFRRQIEHQPQDLSLSIENLPMLWPQRT